MRSRLLESIHAARTRRTRGVPGPRLRSALAALAILGCLLPVPAAAYVDYGFNLVDNSAGGSIMDNYITQELWADTDLRWLGTQFRLQLEQGTIFQDQLGGSDLTAEYSHDLLATTFEQPSLAYDTRIGLNGDAPMLVGGAINIGGLKGIQFTESELDITYGPGAGQYHSGSFDFGTFTLSKDAVGHGALMFSMSGPDHIEYGHYSQTFEIDQGVIRLTGERVNLLDSSYNYTLENWQFVRHEIPPRPPKPEPEPAPEPPAPQPPVTPIDPPEVPSPPVMPVIEPDPAPEPEPLPEPVEQPTEPPTADPDEPIFSPGEPSDRFHIIRWEPPVIDDLSEVWIGADGVPIVIGDFEIAFDLVPVHLIDWNHLIEWNPSSAVLFSDENTTTLDENTTGTTWALRAFDGTPAQTLTTAVWDHAGDLLVPLSALSDAQRTSLLETGFWSVHGDYLLYSGPVGVPEPASIVLVMLAVIAMFRLNARHLDIQCQDGSRWERAVPSAGAGA